MFRIILVMSMLLCTHNLAFAMKWQSHQADNHAPIGVMGDHVHHSGESMIGYRYMTMNMAGNRSGNSSLSVSDSLASFMVAPLDMTMDMHMISAMFAPTDALTLMIMLPYTRKSMNHRKQDLTEFKRQSSGIGDLTLSGLYSLFKEHHHRLHLNTGIRLPVGSIDETDGQSTRLPYPMQLGSGTIDLQLGATYVHQISDWSIGNQIGGIFRLGKNKHDYTLGNIYTGNIWLSKNFSPNISTSLRSQLKVWEDIHGADPDLNPNMVPTAQTNQSGTQVSLALGLNYLVTQGPLKGNRLGFEIGAPVIQSLDGIQLETDWWITVGWQFSP